MKTLAFRAVLALMTLSLLGACTRTVDNTDDDNKNPPTDVQTGDDTSIPDDDTAENPDDDTTVQPPKDIVVPEGCGTIGMTVADLQTREQGLNCVDPAEGESGFINLDQGVELNCVVATSQVFSRTETLEAFFVSDIGGGPYSGILVVMDKGTAPDIQPGDVLSMTGDLKEYYCLSEFDVPDVKVVEAGDAPAATVITTDDFNADPEKYEGVLVEFKNVSVLEIDNYGGFVFDGDITVSDYMVGDGNLPLLDAGCKYDSLIGLVDYSYGHYQLLPRSAADLQAAEGDCEVVEPTNQTIAEVQDSDTSNTCNDEAFVNGGEVSIAGLVVATPRYIVSENKLYGFFATTPDASGPYSGVLVVSDWADDVDLAVGTEFNLKADWTEYYCLTELKVIEIEETGNNLADQIQVTEIAPGDMGEAYEGVVVKVAGAMTVEEAKNNYGEILVSDGIIVKLKFEGVDWNPDVGDTLTSVTGPVDYSYGKYLVMPMSSDDIVTE